MSDLMHANGSSAEGQVVVQPEQTSVEQVQPVPEPEKWYMGQVENAVGNSLLLRLNDTNEQIWVVVNSLTEVPQFKDPISGIAMSRRPRTIDDKGKPLMVEVALKPQYAQLIEFARDRNARKALEAAALHMELPEEKKSVAFVHAAKYANHRSDFFPKTTAEQAQLVPQNGVSDDSQAFAISADGPLSMTMPPVLEME